MLIEFVNRKSIDLCFLYVHTRMVSPLLQLVVEVVAVAQSVGLIMIKQEENLQEQEVVQEDMYLIKYFLLQVEKL